MSEKLDFQLSAWPAQRDQTITEFLTTIVGVADKHSGFYDGFGAYIEA